MPCPGASVLPAPLETASEPAGAPFCVVGPDRYPGGMLHKGFAEVSALSVRRQEGNLQDFDADIDADWTIGGKPHGGYLLALLGRAALIATGQPHVLASAATYLRPPNPGAATVSTLVLREGRSATQVRASISQAGETCVEAHVTVGHIDPASTPYWTAPRAGSVPATACDIDECVALREGPPGGHRVAIMDQVELRLDPASLGYLSAKPSGRGEVRGWLKLPFGEAFDSVSLLFAADALPPATFDIEMAGWVPTLTLTVYVRAVPEPGPVQVLQRAALIQGRLVDETCYVWDAKGALVAQATQLAGIRLG